MMRNCATTFARAWDRAGALMKKGRAQSCDRVRDPPGPYLPLRESLCTYPKEVFNKD
jgi:hypothetical protein